MTIASCRNAKDQGDNRDDWKQGGFSLIEHGPKQEYSGTGTALIYVHGFSNTLDDVFKAYSGMFAVQKQRGINIYGFTWPSEGNIRYFSDLLHVRKSKRALYEFVRSLKRIGYSRVVIQCHSMGSILVMEMLTEDYVSALDVDTVIIHGGDATRKKFKSGRKYGKAAWKLQKLISMWSKRDRILKLAKFFRPVKRIGSYKMVRRAPDNYKSQNYSYTPGCGTIRHGSYKKCKDILDDSVKVALDAG